MSKPIEDLEFQHTCVDLFNDIVAYCCLVSRSQNLAIKAGMLSPQLGGASL